MARSGIGRSEDLIDKLSSDIGGLASAVEQIDELQFATYSEILHRLRTGDLRLYKHGAFSSECIEVVGTSIERRLASLFLFSQFCAPILTAVLGVVFREWALLAALGFVPVSLPFGRGFRGPFVLGGIVALACWFLDVRSATVCIGLPLAAWVAAMSSTLARWTYFRIIFDAALRSEKAFAFLFSAGQIGLMDRYGDATFSGSPPLDPTSEANI